ncbi:MAG: hypothetical protein ACYC9L_05525 [Sulfuricaulis sp.]
MAIMEREQPGQSPQGPAPENVRPLAPPHPVLQQAGFQGSVDEFNQKVPKIVNAYKTAHGVNPSPGIVLDVARSPVSDQQYDKLFNPAFLNPSSVRAMGALAKHDQANPTSVRPDGMIVPQTALSRVVAPAPQDLAAKYPWVPHEAGFVPGISHFGEFANAFGRILGAGPITEETGQIKIAGKSLSDYQQEAKQGQYAPVPGGPLAQMPKDPLAQQKAFQAGAISQDIATIKAGQQELATKFPAFFGDLPVTGNFDSGWVHALDRFRTSTAYYNAATLQMAKDNYFDSPGPFIAAWNEKQKKIRGSALRANEYARIPVAFFGNGKSVLNYIDGNTHNWGWANIPTVALHTIGGLGKTAVVGASALSAGLKSDMAAVGEFLNKVSPHFLGGNGEGLKEATDAAMRVARQNPTWLRAAYPELPDPKNQPLWLKVSDQGTNALLDVVLGNKLVIGGSAVRLGDEAALTSNRYYKGSTLLAHNGMKLRGIDGVGEASKLLQGGEGLNVAVAEKIKANEMTLAKYRQHVADLYHHGRTQLEDGTVLHADHPINTVLSTLREKNLPNPSLIHQQVKSTLDSFEQSVRNSGLKGTDNAANMWQTVRQQFARAAPNRARIYDPKAPDDLYNWVITHLHDRNTAYQARNNLVVARAQNDIPAIQNLMENLARRYAAENPNIKGKAAPLGSEGPVLEAESQSYLKLLSGRQRDATGLLTKLENDARAINAKLNQAGALHRQVIIGLPGFGESLFYKHMFADTARRFAGGGGLRFGLSKAQKGTRDELARHFAANPADLREFSYNRAMTTMGEAHYIRTNRVEDIAKFNTGDAGLTASHFEAAGAYLRTMLHDNALTAYRASTRTDKTPLFRHVWHSDFYQNKIAADPNFKKEAAVLRDEIAPGKWLTQALSDLKKRYARDWTDVLYTRYRAIEEAGAKVGKPDALAQAQQASITHAGAKVDAKLGQFIKDNKLEFDVTDAPIRSSSFDNAMQSWTGKLMTFNKLNRQTMFDHIFYNTYDTLTKGGWEPTDALAASQQLAKAQTVYHMLDFSNMLQVEQNLRWLSYFATKHRLYWTWIAKQFIHKPLLAAAVADVGQHLKNGNLNVTVDGHQITIPVARLFWVNQTEYPETSPIVETGVRAITNFAHKPGAGAFTDAISQETATSGNVFTREDQTIYNSVKYVKALLGGLSYGVAIDGMSQAQRSVFNEEMHNYILSYRAHNNGRYPSESDAVKATLLRATGLEVWRANMFLPAYLNVGPSSEIQNLHAQFDKITDPKKRSEFLVAHPKLQDSFGASVDQGLYLHNQPLWDQFHKATVARDAQMKTLRDQIDVQGYTPAIAKQIRAVSATYRTDIQRIRTQDAQSWAGNKTYPPGKVADNGEILQTGPWGLHLDGDPIAANAYLHELFPKIGRPEFTAHTIGQTVLDLQAESDRVRQLGWQKLGYPDQQHAKDRLSQIYQTISTLQSLPKNPTSQMVSAYYSKYVDPYRALRTKLTIAQKGTSSADKNTVYALTRAIKERYDHSVTVVDPVNGKRDTFPSPVSFGFTLLPPDLYRTALAGAVSGRWQDITGYEKTLLGVQTPTRVAEGWLAYQKTVSEYERVPTNPGLVASQKLALAQQIDKVYPGFLKDFKFSLQPKVGRYESTTLYKTMPAAVRSLFDQTIGTPANQVAAAIKANGHATYYMRWWRNYVRDQIKPWLDSEPAVKAELARYGADFLDTLPAAG